MKALLMGGAVLLGLIAAGLVNSWGHVHFCESHPKDANCVLEAPAAAAKP